MNKRLYRPLSGNWKDEYKDPTIDLYFHSHKEKDSFKEFEGKSSDWWHEQLEDSWSHIDSQMLRILPKEIERLRKKGRISFSDAEHYNEMIKSPDTDNMIVVITIIEVKRAEERRIFKGIYR